MARQKAPYIRILAFWSAGTVLILCFTFSSRCSRKRTEDLREKEVLDMVASINASSNMTFIVDPEVLAVSGEEDDWDYSGPGTSGPASPSSAVPSGSSAVSSDPSSEDPAQPDTTETSGGTQEGAVSDNAEYVLTAYGTISIPSIDCELPLWEGAGTIELRYGAGRMPLSCEAGQPGNLVIFGHRMRRDGSLFNRLGQVEIGDAVLIQRNGENFTYLIDGIETIEPSRLSQYMYPEEDADACRITLITCTPTGVGTHRLVLIGHLVSS